MYHNKSYRTIFYNNILEERYRTMFYNKVLEQSTRTMFYNNVIEDFSITMYQYICTYLPPTQFGVWPTQFRYPYRQRNLPCTPPTQCTSKLFHMSTVSLVHNNQCFSNTLHICLVPSMHVCLHRIVYISSYLSYIIISIISFLVQ